MQGNSNLRPSPEKNMSVIYPRNKMHTKKKYFTINLMHKACQMLSTFTN